MVQKENFRCHSVCKMETESVLKRANDNEIVQNFLSNSH